MRAQQIEGFKQRPVDQKECFGRKQRRVRTAVRDARSVGGKNPKYGNAVPFQAYGEIEQRHRQRNQGDHGKRRGRRGCESGKCAEVRHCSESLRTIKQRMPNHSRGNQKDAERSRKRVVDDLCRGQCVDRIGRGIKGCPTRADQPSGEHLILGGALCPHARREDGNTDSQRDGRASARCHLGE